jgi:protein-tyrosine phosphatase
VSLTQVLVDIHAHLLPGIDDGPKELEGALQMARAAVAVGIDAIAATPHLRADFPAVHVEEIAGRCESLRTELALDGIGLRVVGGAEVSLVWAVEASDDALVLATYDQRGTDLLIETPAIGVSGLDRLLYGLHGRGFRVTLAHPERNPEFQREPAPLRELVSQGVLLQVNADSLLEANRRSPLRRLAERLCRDGLAHVLASDGHRADSWRPVTRLAQAVAAAEGLVGPDRAHWMVYAAPTAIIEGEPLPDPPAISPPARKSRLFGRS